MTATFPGATRAAAAVLQVLMLAVPAVAFSQDVDAIIRNGGKATLTGSVATYGGHDKTSLDTTRPTGDSRRTSDGNYGGGSGAVSWLRPTGRVALSATGSTDLRYYTTTGALSGLTGRTTSGSFAAGIPTGRRTTLRLSQSASLSSFFQFDPFSGLALRNPEDLLLPTSDYRVERSRTYTIGTAASLNTQVGRFSRLTFDYGMRYVNFPGELLSYASHSQGMRFERRLKQSLSLNTGYGFDFSTISGANGGQYHRIDLGLGYDARLPFSRNTQFSVSTGGAVVATRSDVTQAVEQVPLVTVTSTLRHPFSRRWTAMMEYRRAPRVVELYRNPTYGDFGVLSLQGSLARRVQLSLSGGIARDKLDAGRGSLASQTRYGSANLSVRATSRLFAYGEYAYFDFETGSALSITVPQRNIRRQAVRGGLYWRLPLFRPIQGQ
jgi:hypothetical protein